jgi:hypothetical protein
MLIIIKPLQKTFPFSFTESLFRIRFSISNPGFQKSSPCFLKDESGFFSSPNTGFEVCHQRLPAESPSH